MKSKNIIHEVSNTLAMNSLEQTGSHLFKVFSLPSWLVIISVSLGFISQSVRADAENIHPYYRYIPYQGPSNTSGTGSQQQPKTSGGASDIEAQKANKGEQATGTGGKPETASPTAGTPSEQVKTSPSEQKTGEAATTSKSEEKATSGESTTGTGASQAPTGQTTPQSPSAKEPKTEGDQKPATEQKIAPAKQPEKDTGEFPSGKLPSFGQVDINGDHYITKDELQNFPELLQVFDKVDAGKDGRLEQHEYQNLEMETIREGEVL